MPFDSAICIFCGVRLQLLDGDHEVTLRERVCSRCWQETLTGPNAHAMPSMDPTSSPLVDELPKSQNPPLVLML